MGSGKNIVKRTGPGERALFHFLDESSSDIGIKSMGLYRNVEGFGISTETFNIDYPGAVSVYTQGSKFGFSHRWYIEDGFTENIDAAAAVDLGSGNVGIPITGHSFEPNMHVNISGTTNYDGRFTLAAETADDPDFIVIGTSYNAEVFAGTETVQNNGFDTPGSPFYDIDTGTPTGINYPSVNLHIRTIGNEAGIAIEGADNSGFTTFNGPYIDLINREGLVANKQIVRTQLDEDGLYSVDFITNDFTAVSRTMFNVDSTSTFSIPEGDLRVTNFGEDARIGVYTKVFGVDNSTPLGLYEFGWNKDVKITGAIIRATAEGTWDDSFPLEAPTRIDFETQNSAAGTTLFEPALRIDSGQITYIGNINGSNYTQIAKDGSITLVGDARKKKRIIIPTELLRTGVPSPLTATVGITPIYSFSQALTQSIHGKFEIPEDWDSTTDMIVTVYWAPPNTDSAAVVWAMDYNSLAPNSAELLTAATTKISATSGAAFVADELIKSGISMTILGSNLAANDIFSFEFYRDTGSGADNYGSSAYLVHIEIEYTINKLGE